MFPRCQKFLGRLGNVLVQVAHKKSSSSFWVLSQVKERTTLEALRKMRGSILTF